MAISTYALVSLDELVEHLRQPYDQGKLDVVRIRIINSASAEIENWLGRNLVTRGSLTEYHSPDGQSETLYLGEWPVTAVTSVHEDTNWPYVANASRYPASSLLVSDTDYLAIKPTREPDQFGQLLRLQGSVWAAGRRVVKVVYTAGYATTATVPPIIKDVCLELCALKWRDRDRSELGVASRTDAVGTVTRMVPALLTQAMQSRLRNAGYRPRVEFAYAETWERDAA